MATNQGISAEKNTEPQVLVAHVNTGDSVCIVRADEVSKALVALHGTPKHGLKVKVSVEYVWMSAASLADMEAFDRSGLQHCD